MSTVGVVPKMKQLNRDLPGVQIALSLHAPTQETRVRLVPSAKAWPLEKLMEAVDQILAVEGRRVMIEYIVIRDVNDSEENAHLLGQLLGV